MTSTQGSPGNDDQPEITRPSNGDEALDVESVVDELSKELEKPVEKRLQKLIARVPHVRRAILVIAGMVLSTGTGWTGGIVQFFNASTAFERVMAIVFIAAVTVSTTLCVLVLRKGVGSSTAGSLARSMVVLTTIFYGVISLYGVETNVSDEDLLSRWGSGIWLVLAVSTTALASRTASSEPPGEAGAFARAQKILLFLLGSAIFGAGSALIARDIHDAAGTYTYRFLPSFGEGLLVCLLGLALLLARRVSAAIVMIGVGVVVAVFGAAVLDKGDVLLGASTVAIGASAVAVGVGLRWYLQELVKFGFLAGTAGSFSTAWNAISTHVVAFGITMVAVTGFLLVLTVLLFTQKMPDWQFDVADEDVPWKPSKVTTVGVCVLSLGAVAGVPAVWAIQDGDTVSVIQVAGVSLAAVVLGVLVLASRQRLTTSPQPQGS